MNLLNGTKWYYLIPFTNTKRKKLNLTGDTVQYNLPFV